MKKSRIFGLLGMQDSKSVNTPVGTSVKIIEAAYNKECVDQQLYQSAIGSLLCL